jgi:GlpG protein
MQGLAVLAAPLETDLSPLTEHLWAQRIVHRVVEDNQQQILILADPADIPRVENLLQRWQAGELTPAATSSRFSPGRLMQRIWQTPVAASLVLILVCVFAWQHISPDWISWLRESEGLWPEARNRLSTYTDLGFWALWRPTILHFSVLHILFNALWVWIFVGAIEKQGERGAILALVIFCGLGGNLLQWWVAGPAFGGASGVVYGLCAYTGLRQTRFRIPYGIPKGVLILMVVMMLFTITGDTLIPGLSGIANGGHLGGLLVGFLLAVVWPVTKRGQDESR